MEKAPIPTADLRALPRLARQSFRGHRTLGEPRRDFRFLANWKPGPAAGAPGEAVVSLTQFTPKRLRDLIEIWRVADRLGEMLVEIDGACGVVTYIQPGRRRLGSLSIWTREAGLGEFVALPEHIEIMRRFGPRGLPLRSVKWWSAERDPIRAMAEGQRLLERSRKLRLVVPRGSAAE